jgi:hypothetical protein
MRKERRDANEGKIIAALRQAGCEVWQLCAREPADLLVLTPWSTGRPLMMLEVKDGAKPKSARCLTPKQQQTHQRWPISVVETVEQALQMVRGGV